MRPGPSLRPWCCGCSVRIDVKYRGLGETPISNVLSTVGRRRVMEGMATVVWHQHCLTGQPTATHRCDRGDSSLQHLRGWH
jgi:hypothetical protein